jgi:hypothetical protein
MCVFGERLILFCCNSETLLQIVKALMHYIEILLLVVRVLNVFWKVISMWKVYVWWKCLEKKQLCIVKGFNFFIVVLCFVVSWGIIVTCQSFIVTFQSYIINHLFIGHFYLKFQKFNTLHHGH